MRGSDYMDWALALKGAPRIVIVGSDPMGPNPGVVTFYFHRQARRRLRVIRSRAFQYQMRPVSIVWRFRARSHAWLRRASQGSQVLVTNESGLRGILG